MKAVPIWIVCEIVDGSLEEDTTHLIESQAWDYVKWRASQYPGRKFIVLPGMGSGEM